MKPEVTSSLNRRYLLLVFLLALALYVLVPQLGAFKSSWQLLGESVPGWTALAIALTALTYLSGAMTYYLLAIKPLKYGSTVLVQLAAMFINRLLPAGLGAIGANYAYLRRHRHTGTQAGTVVALNNLLGLVGHALLVFFAIVILSGRQASLTPNYGHAAGSAVKVAVLAMLVVVGLGVLFGRRRFRRQVAKLRLQILSYRRRPGRLAAALLSSMTLTMANILSLWACALAVGVHPSPITVLLVFTFGVGTGTVTPVPGGLGGYEAGLTAGFIAYGTAAPAALAAALLYRLVSYWLPLGFGALAFIVSRQRQMF